MFKVAITDDNQQYAEMIGAYLQSKDDIEVVGIAEDGFSCLDLIRNTKPDIVLLDMMMKHMDGIAVLDRIQRMSPRPKVIILSGMTSDYMVERAMLKGAMDYLVKPFDLECLYERVVDIGRSGYGYGVYQQGDDGTMMAAEPVAAYRSASRGNSSNRRKSIEVVVTELMHEMGIPAHVKGYQYLRDAILRVLSDENLVNNITKELYPKVANKYNTSPDRVERAIRHAIELAWVRGNVDLMTEYFGYTINLQKGKPTNAEFIAMVSDRIRLNY